ncbi:MAG TPA: Tc toxin subunit A, partial [Magnetospirillum sp.]|nr:Tc toxin subunit A [Magnetospirillum sp.]
MLDKPAYSRLNAHLGQPLPLSSLAESHPALARLASANPQLDLLRANLFDPTTINSLGAAGPERDQLLDNLRACQRLARIGVAPHEMEALRQAGLHSAHQIASLPRDTFATKFGGTLRVSGDAADIHALACSVQARATHAWAWLRDTMAPHVRNNRYLRPSDELLEAMAAIPSYNDLFGTLDYVSVPDCQSVLGPAAYFVDLMRLIEQQIIAPNTAIPADWQLKTRRPDLFSIELTCPNTNTAIPKIDVINDALAARLRSTLGTDTDYAV